MKKLTLFFAAMCCTMGLMATNVGDTIPYYYKGDTLWYQVQPTCVYGVTPAPSGYGTHAEPKGVLYIPDSIEVDGVKVRVLTLQNIFDELQNIDEVYIEGGVESCNNTFRYSSINKVHIPNSLLDFGNGTFAYCAQLDSVILDDPDHFVSNAWDTWTSSSKPYARLGNNEYLRLGNGVYAYKGIVYDSTLTIPNDVKFVSSYLTFYNGETYDADVRAVVLPATLTKIDQYPFFYCTGITKVTCLATVPPTAEEYAFYTDDNTSTQIDLRTQATLYVPYSEDHSILAAYQSAEVWKDFSNIVEFVPAGIDEVRVSEPKAQKVLVDGVIYILRGDKVYNLHGIECEIPQK